MLLILLLFVHLFINQNRSLGRQGEFGYSFTMSEMSPFHAFSIFARRIVFSLLSSQLTMAFDKTVAL